MYKAQGNAIVFKMISLSIKVKHTQKMMLDLCLYALGEGHHGKIVFLLEVTN